MILNTWGHSKQQTVHKRGEEESTCRVEWVEMICDRVKVKVYKMIETFYGAWFGDFGAVLVKTWKTELRFSLVVTRMYVIRNEYIRGQLRLRGLETKLEG